MMAKEETLAIMKSAAYNIYLWSCNKIWHTIYVRIIEIVLSLYMCLMISSKAKEKEEKKQRQARFAFMTKSEVDNLEDGYRWRKYGQKAVKNSSFPR